MKVKVKQDQVTMMCCRIIYFVDFPCQYIRKCKFCKEDKPSYYVERAK